MAVEQAVALRASGHDVVIAGGARGYRSLPRNVMGVPTRLFRAVTPPRTGLLGLTAPGLWRWMRDNARTADVIHVHLARDLVVLPSAALALRSGTPYFLQTHGMVMPTTNPLAPLLDSALTRRVLDNAKRVFYLTPQERDGLAVVAPRARLEQLRNGVSLPSQAAHPAAPGADVQVLFMARLQERKRPLAFVAMAATVARQHPEVHFRLLGPDEGQGRAVSAAIAESQFPDRIRWDGPIDPEFVLNELRQASLYVLPSVNEPYPMSVLEAMSLGVPVVVTDTCGLAPLIAKYGGGAVIGSGQEALDEAVRRYLADPESMRRDGARARVVAETVFGMSSVVTQLEWAYRADPAT